MRPTPTEIQFAVRRLSSIAFFPADEFARESIMDDLASFVGGAPSLDWLVRSAIAAMGQWRGPAELRALYCTRFKPLDGVEGGPCSIRGFTPEDNEGRPALEATTTRYLPAPGDSTISDEERQQIDSLDEKVKLRSALCKTGTGSRITQKPLEATAEHGESEETDGSGAHA